jgi:hypothetical protein
MNREENYNYNKMCVNILGWKKLAHGYNTWSDAKEGEERYETPFSWEESDVSSLYSTRYDFDVSQMPFSDDWNWIMIVVVAISKIKYTPNVSGDTTLSTKKQDLKSALGSADKESAVKHIYDILTWVGTFYPKEH